MFRGGFASQNNLSEPESRIFNICNWSAVQFYLLAVQINQIAVGLRFRLTRLRLGCGSDLPDCGWVAVQIYLIVVQIYLIAVGLQLGCGSDLPDCVSVVFRIHLIAVRLQFISIQMCIPCAFQMMN